MQPAAIPTRSSGDLPASKGSNSVPQHPPPRSPAVLKKKALSMFNLFSHHHRRRQQQQQQQQDHSSLCASPVDYCTPSSRPPSIAGRHPKLKKCASAIASSGWGMVPVLNELEQRAPFIHPSRWSRRESQCICLNCGCLFFKQLSGIEADFCSLDCQASHAYTLDMQDVVDMQLELNDSMDGWSDTNSSAYSLSSGSGS